ncbi:MAG TPA: hypothetical protein VHR66_19325 [Gemmataceae bacterium]|jgi:hypothetical protein|nr:hypothetical protein [Gemmataceae bacterium]
MKRYRYVILSSYGASWDISREINKPLGGLMQLPWFGDLKYQDLQELLDRGWQPVRETGMGGASATGGAAVAFSLIVLEKDRPETTAGVAPTAEEQTREK